MEGDKYKTPVLAVPAPSHAIQVDERTSYHTTKEQSNYKKIVIGKATTFTERDEHTWSDALKYNDTTWCARMQDQSALNNSEVHRHPECGEKHTERISNTRT